MGFMLELPFEWLSGKKVSFVSAQAAKAYKDFGVYIYTIFPSDLDIIGQPQRTISLPQGREYPVANEY